MTAQTNGGARPARQPAATRLAHEAPGVFELAESGPDDGFATFDLIAALRGVSRALRRIEGEGDVEEDVVQLHSALHVLTALLHARQP